MQKKKIGPFIKPVCMSIFKVVWKKREICLGEAQRSQGKKNFGILKDE